MSTEAPDFRSEKMESPEGRGIAYGRWAGFHHSLPEDLVTEAFGGHHSIEDYDDETRDDIAESVLADSELIGFWVAWHQAGGFSNLERGGWHRATIFRKLRRFRSRFGAHPDDFQFSWIKLDLKRSWTDGLTQRLGAEPGGA
jgi:hypothetical protein